MTDQEDKSQSDFWDSLPKWAAALISALLGLIVAGVIGYVALVPQISSLQTSVESLNTSQAGLASKDSITAVDRRLDDLATSDSVEAIQREQEELASREYVEGEFKAINLRLEAIASRLLSRGIPTHRAASPRYRCPTRSAARLNDPGAKIGLVRVNDIRLRAGAAQ